MRIRVPRPYVEDILGTGAVRLRIRPVPLVLPVRKTGGLKSHRPCGHGSDRPEQKTSQDRTTTSGSVTRRRTNWWWAPSAVSCTRMPLEEGILPLGSMKW